MLRKKPPVTPPYQLRVYEPYSTSPITWQYFAKKRKNK